MATAEKTVHVSEFTNEPFIDFSKPENRKRMEDALKKVKSEFGREYPMWLGGQKVTTTEKRTSTNPRTNISIPGRKFPPRTAPSVFSAPRKSSANANLS